MADDGYRPRETPFPDRPRRRRSAWVVALGVAAAAIVVVVLRKPAVEQWSLWQLGSDDETMRAAAAERLGELRSARGVVPLIELLKSSAVAPEPPEEGVSYFGRARENKRTSTALKIPDEWWNAATSHWSPYERALVAIGAPTVREIPDLVKSEGEDARFSAARILGRIGAPAQRALAELLEDHDEATRILAAGGLGVRGHVIGPDGNPVKGAKVYLGGHQGLAVHNGRVYSDGVGPGETPPAEDEDPPFFVTTDAEGKFHYLGAKTKESSIVVTGPGLAPHALRVSDIRHDVEVRMPESATLVVHYSVDGDDPEANPYIRLETHGTPWQSASADICTWSLPIKNGAKRVFRNVVPGWYHASRVKWQSLGASWGSWAQAWYLDQEGLVVESGKTVEIRFVRERGQPIHGELILLGSEKPTFSGIFVTVRSEEATEAEPLNNLVSVLDALKYEDVGTFRTARVPPGTYRLRVGGYESEPLGADTLKRSFGFSSPSPTFVAAADIAVPEDGRLEPLRIELARVGVTKIDFRGVRISSSHTGVEDTLTALNDGVLPGISSDPSLPRFTWTDHRGTREWVQYAFPEPRRVSAVSVYWFDDEGQCRLPASWRVLARRGDEWVPVTTTEAPAVAKDRFNDVRFDPVTTDGVRLELQLRPEKSAGILEWIVR